MLMLGPKCCVTCSKYTNLKKIVTILLMNLGRADLED